MTSKLNLFIRESSKANKEADMNYGIENLRPTKGVHHQYIRNARIAECTVAGICFTIIAAVAVAVWYVAAQIGMGL